MTTLVLGLVIFLGLHSTRIVAEGGRAKAIRQLGEGPWKGVYSLLSLIGLVLIIWGFAQARWTADRLWSPPVWTRHTTILLMLISLILISAYIFKKSHIAVAAHHPMVWAWRFGPRGIFWPMAQQRTWCCLGHSSSGRSRTWSARTAATDATPSSIPRRAGARRPAQSAPASCYGRLWSAGCISGCSASRRWRASSVFRNVELQAELPHTVMSARRLVRRRRAPGGSRGRQTQNKNGRWLDKMGQNAHCARACGSTIPTIPA